MIQKVVFLGRQLVEIAASYVLLGFDNYPPDGRFYNAPDPEAKRFTNIFTFSSKLKITHVGHIKH